MVCRAIVGFQIICFSVKSTCLRGQRVLNGNVWEIATKPYLKLRASILFTDYCIFTAGQVSETIKTQIAHCKSLSPQPKWTPDCPHSLWGCSRCQTVFQYTLRLGYILCTTDRRNSALLPVNDQSLINYLSNYCLLITLYDYSITVRLRKVNLSIYKRML